MPHIVTFDGLFATQAGFQEPDDFLKLGDIKSAFQADELTGRFDAVSSDRDISGIAWGDPDRQQLEGQAFLREQGFAVRGEGRPTKIWTSGSGTSFDDRDVGDYDANDAVFGMRENLGGTFAFETGLPVEGLHDSVHCITDGCSENAPIGDRLPTDNIGSTSGPGGSSFMTETFEPAAGMNSFGESLNPVLEVGGNAGPGGSTFMTGQFEIPTNNLTGSADPGGDDI